VRAEAKEEAARLRAAGAAGISTGGQSQEVEPEDSLMRRIIATAVSIAAVSAAGLACSSPALAAEACESCRPWWHLTSGSRPTVLSPGSPGQVVLTAANLGDGSLDAAPAAGGPVTITDVLPPGLEAKSVEAVSGRAPGPGENDGPVKCSFKLKPLVTCVFESVLPPYDQIEIRIGVEVAESATAGEQNEVRVSGGGARAASIVRPISLGEGPTPFGVEDYELANEEVGGVADTRAGSHPFQQTTTITLNQASSFTEFLGIGGSRYRVSPVALPKDLSFRWSPGLFGNPTPIPRCTIGQFTQAVGGSGESLCPLQTIVGVATVTINEPGNLGMFTFVRPVYNLEPAFGQPARFGFSVPPLNAPILIDPALRAVTGDYGITVSTPNITEIAGLLSSKVTVWGVPGDPRHDNSRGAYCLNNARGVEETSCNRLQQVHPPAFLTLPTSCGGPAPQTSVQADSWLAPSERLSFPGAPMPPLDGCNRLSFSPSMSAETSTDRASAPSGLDFNLDFHDEGLTSAEGTAQSQLKDTVVTLPEGLTINPSAGVGLGGCSPVQYASETLISPPGAGCPNDSKLGTVEIETPLLTQKIHGSLFIAQPYDNPFPEPETGHPNGTLVALYVVAKNPETGVLIKLAGKVTTDPVTGRLTTSFEDNPQLPFSHFNFHFREGQQAPLISPPACGTYTVQAQLTPWSEPMAALSENSSFTITKGFDGGACPSGGIPPFDPGITSGLLNNNAGAFSPFYLHLTRTDAEQEITGFSTDLPPGVTGDLTGIPFCPEADIEAARQKTGAEEEANPSCPAASRIGRSLVGTGVGAVLAYVPGKIYLAGPYKGDSFSLVSVTSALVGPFDLGTVVIRFALKIDPNTAQVSVDPSGSEPIPHILRGIVTHVRDIRVYVDRPNFTLNSTSCNPMSISSTLTSNQGQAKTVSSPFQASNCQALQFKPIFKVSTSGKTSRSKGASLSVKLAYPKAPLGTQANIAKVKVDLPKQLPSRLTTLQKACPDSTFNANPAACPAASRVGFAKAITPLIPATLEGPAYFVSHGGAKFPELIIVLQGYGVTIDLRGETFISKAGITSSTFPAVPDQPVTSFELTLPQGQNSALAANGNLCKTKLKMPTAFTAQNGAIIKQSTPISVTGCAKHKQAHKTKTGHNKRKGKKK
jgi:hypothetical protein